MSHSTASSSLPLLSLTPLDIYSPEFKRLDALIVAFRMSFPKEYKNILGKDNNGTEITLISAHVIPHASTILLHEAFCTRAEDVSMQRCLTSARAILGIIYLLWDTNKDIALLQPFICFCYAVAGRKWPSGSRVSLRSPVRTAEIPCTLVGSQERSFGTLPSSRRQKTRRARPV